MTTYIYFQFIMSPMPLIPTLIENKLNDDNYKDWKRNLLIVLSCERHKFVLDEPCQPGPLSDAPLKVVPIMFTR